MTGVIPEEITHLDFNPDSESDEEFSLFKECGVSVKGSKKKDCLRPASWCGTYRCCGKKFYSCNQHKQSGAIVGWWCSTCKKVRDHEWIGWARL